MVEILKNLVSENVLAALLILLGILREARLLLKVILNYKLQKNKK